MKVLEVKNNLVKIEYKPEDNLLLSGFVIIEDSQSPYVAQILSLKADKGINYAIVKLLFTFNEEGIVKNYDGTIPSLDADVTRLNAEELLDILPVKTPLEIGTIAHQNINLKVDMSIFEKNLLICSDNNEDSNILIENFIYQLNENGCKTLLFDTDDSFSGEKLVFGRDFKLPLNYETINFIYDHDLGNIDPASKAVIQDIFLEVQEYSKTVLDKFIPFDDFLNVVSSQYHELGIPELILLKNKLLKYKEMNVFAQTAKEIQTLRSAIRGNSSNILDISGAEEVLQGEIVKYVYNAIDEMDLFVYSFVQLNNENADKKLIRHILGKNKIYTTLISSHNFKYLYELKERSTNLILFPPQVMQHDFTAYNTFLNKLNPEEFIIYGKATQNIPLIVELSSLFEEEEEENTELTPLQQIADSKEAPVVKTKEDDFSEESNSYSYDTLIKDTVTLPPPQIQPLEPITVQINKISNQPPAQETLQVMETTSPEEVTPIAAPVVPTIPESDAKAIEIKKTEDYEYKEEIKKDPEKDLSEDNLHEDENLKKTEVVSDTKIPSDEKNVKEDSADKASKTLDEEIEQDYEKDINESESDTGDDDEEFEDGTEARDDDDEFEDGTEAGDDDEEFEDGAEAGDDDEEFEDGAEAGADEAEGENEPEDGDDDSESKSDDPIDTEAISSIIDKEIEDEILTNPDNDEIIEGEFHEVEETPAQENSVEQSENDIVLPSLEEISPELNASLNANENLSAGNIEDFWAQEDNELNSDNEPEQSSQEDLTEDDLNFIQNVNTPVEESSLPVYPAEDLSANNDVPSFAAGDHVSHPKYGEGVVEKTIRYGTKSLCSISFVNIGRRLLDPAISEITKLG